MNSIDIIIDKFLRPVMIDIQNVISNGVGTTFNDLSSKRLIILIVYSLTICILIIFIWGPTISYLSSGVSFKSISIRLLKQESCWQ